MQRRVLSSGSLSGDAVTNAEGDQIADIKDLMIDLDSGRVAYVVVSYGGFLGFGDKLFAVPWQAVRVDQDARTLVIDLDEEVLGSAPGFDKDAWPDFADPGWVRQMDDHYGLENDWLLT